MTVNSTGDRNGVIVFFVTVLTRCTQHQPKQRVQCVVSEENTSLSDSNEQWFHKQECGAALRQGIWSLLVRFCILWLLLHLVWLFKRREIMRRLYVEVPWILIWSPDVAARKSVEHIGLGGASLFSCKERPTYCWTLCALDWIGCIVDWGCHYLGCVSYFWTNGLHLQLCSRLVHVCPITWTYVDVFGSLSTTLVRLLTTLRRIFSTYMAITNSCAPRRDIPHCKNQSKTKRKRARR